MRGQSTAMPKFLTALWCELEAVDEVAAQMAAYDLEEHVKNYLEDNESVEASDVVSDESSLSPLTDIRWLLQARNILIRTRTKDGFDLARELDKAAHALRVRLGVEESMTSYDWSQFLKAAQEILNGGNPL